MSRRLAHLTALACLASAAFITGATLHIAAPGLAEAAERAQDVERWLDEGCSTDSDCDEMEQTIGLDHLER